MKINRKPKIKRLFNQQSGHCAYCGCEMTLELGNPHTATRDHATPRSKGGLSNEFNEVASCYRCNQLKADKPLSVFIGELWGNEP